MRSSGGNLVTIGIIVLPLQSPAQCDGDWQLGAVLALVGPRYLQGCPAFQRLGGRVWGNDWPFSQSPLARLEGVSPLQRALARHRAKVAAGALEEPPLVQK